jgi:hypothetical protein
MDTRQTITNGALKVSPGISTDAMAALGLYAQVTPYGRLKVSAEPGSLFVDAFDGVTVDTTNRWTLSGTAVPTQAAGTMTLNGGTTNSASSVAVSQPTFLPPGLGFRQYASAITLSAAKVANHNKHQFFGVGVVTAYAIGTPLTDGFGMEVDITGELCLVVWVAGVRYVINSTNTALITAQGSLPTGAATSTFGRTLSWPTPGPHIYFMEDRGDSVFFFIDSLDAPVGYAANLQPQVQALPLRLAAINAAAAVQASTFTLGGVVLGDSTSQNQTISDATYPWRRAVVGAAGAQKVESVNSYNHVISTAGTYVVSSAPGMLHSITINSKSAAAGLITVYDNTAASGAVIAVIDAASQVGTFTFDVALTIGLTIVTSGVPGADLTVSYR